MCFEKRKKSVEKDAIKAKQVSLRHIQSEREIVALDVEEMSKPQAELAAVDKDVDGTSSNWKVAAVDFQKAQKVLERELNEAENELKRSLHAVYNETAELDRAQEEDYKV
jgi:hypothetical protein